MADTSSYQKRREELVKRYLSETPAVSSAVQTNGIDHLALICADLDATIQFYSEVLGMPLTKIVPNRDDPTSTHIFFDIGGGNQLAFFDFPAHGPAHTVRGVGSMHHVALRASASRFGAIVERLRQRGVQHSLHGSTAAGSVYLRDPDGILVEVTTGY